MPVEMFFFAFIVCVIAFMAILHITLDVGLSNATAGDVCWFYLCVLFIFGTIAWPSTVALNYDTEYVSQEEYTVDTVWDQDVINVDGELINMNRAFGRDFNVGDVIIRKIPRQLYGGIDY